MKVNKLCYSPFNKFVFRSPTFPFSFLNSFIKNDYVADEYFVNILNDKVVREAIFLASPALSEELQQLLSGNNKDPKYIKELRISLSKYLIRMASRCTPFGLFAGFSLGELGDRSDIRLESIANYNSHTRFDMNYLVALSQDLIKNPAIRNNVRFYPNSSINRIESKIRYVEYKYKQSKRTHNIVSVDNSIYLEKILRLAEKGSRIDELSNTIVDDEIIYETANEFVNELIDSQLLVSDIEPSITGDEYIHQLLKVLENITGIDEIKYSLKSAQKCIEEIDKAKLGESADKYIPISEQIKALKTEFKINYLFQTDLFKPAETAVLDRNIADEILEGVDFLSKLSFEPPETNMSKFIERFEKKYADNEICILDALDPESGIGFLPPSGGEDNPPLLEKLPLRYSVQSGDKIYWNRNIDLIDKKIIEAIKNNSQVVELTDDDVKGFESKLNKMAPTFSVVAKIIGKNENDIEQIYLSSTGGSNSAYLTGRFCHADEETNKFTKDMVTKEEELLKDFVVAEIVHLPQARVGNVLLHPQFHEYEIPYLARSNADDTHQIKPDDLYLSLYGKNLVLRSKRLNKRVVPRLSNAHNFSFNAQPIYQFLCEMQFQDILRGVSLPLGNALDRYGHVPRITYKNIIFHLAVWKIQKKEIENFSKIKDGKELIDKVRAWRTKRNIPKLVSLEEGDNTLLINLENTFCIEMLLSSLKGNDFKVIEFLFDEENAIVRSSEGSYPNEFILSYYRDDT